MNEKYTSAALRKCFLEFFQSKSHHIVRSSPLIPGNDPTLMFTAAGMVQFKDVFVGAEKRSYKRAVSSQRCLRAGGKHNDLDQVGYTARHHTLFEMLGNFSFGDYFKREAIQYAWQFLTQTLDLPKEKLWVTIYEEDQEAADIWLNEIGISPAQFVRIGDKPGAARYESDNFWAMGDVGPCGPCTEIFYDHGEAVEGGPPGSPDEDGDRYVEIWNLVFMQYDRDESGQLNPLPKPCVDTGMGLERLSAVMQGFHSNYQIDLFQALIQRAAQLTQTDDLSHPSLKVIADHIRATAFMIVDGVLPSNEGRGYVLRRIIRRAVRQAYQLGHKQPFFFKMVEELAQQMGEAYPELISKQADVEQALEKEEIRFAETLDKGLAILEQSIKGLKDQTIPGDVVFKLYDTFGFPVDLTADIARERNLLIDQAGFETCMADQKSRARAASQFASQSHIEAQALTDLKPTIFTGYSADSTPECKVVALFQDNKAIDVVKAGEKADVILDQTPFYAESGGQVGDAGLFKASGMSAKVTDTQKLAGAFHLHQIAVQAGALKTGQIITAEIDAERRDQIRLNHTATHLLHAALRQELGEHVQQKGSLVDADKLRFDFSHPEPVSEKTLQRIAQVVNEQIRCNREAVTQELAFDQAVAAGAMALFGEKYGENVRMLTLGQFSVELCGGTHVKRAGDIGLFYIVQETGIAAGIRRIEAITGAKAWAAVQTQENIVHQSGQLLKSTATDLPDKIQQLLDKNRSLEKALSTLQTQMAGQAGDALQQEAVKIGQSNYLVAELAKSDAKTLRETAEKLRDQLEPSAILLASHNGEKISLVALISKSLTKQLKAGEWVNVVAKEVDGKGGGRPDMAQAGGNAIEKLPQALESGKQWITDKLSVLVET